jgi:preprotein translocase subunit SecD
VILIRYRKFVVSIPVAITLASELIILLGFASLIGWNIDLIAIAAIIIAIGTGVDSQIVIIDEISGKHKDESMSANWKDRIKNAFFIIMASYFTMVVAMIPLLSAGAGLLKGFAITTILGVSIGVFITRPAFAVIAETLLRRDD